MPQIVVPASIHEAPRDVTLLRGNSIELTCTLKGTPPVKSVWRKGKNEVRCFDGILWPVAVVSCNRDLRFDAGGGGED